MKKVLKKTMGLLMTVIMIGSMLVGSVSVSANFDEYCKLEFSGIGFAIPG